MSIGTPGFDEPHEFDNPLGMSRYSIRRHSVRHFLLLFSLLALIIAINVQAVLAGHVALMAVAAAALLVAVLMTGLITLIGIRSVVIELWIRRLGMGDFEYSVEPWGRDELSQMCLALETLRQNSIRAMQLDTVRRLSNELQEKNAELEQALADLRRSQDRIISQQKLAELGELSSGVAHEMRNPLQFIINFTSASIDVVAEMEEVLKPLGESEREEADELVRDLKENMERVLHHGNRANGIVSAMMIFDRGTGGGFPAGEPEPTACGADQPGAPGSEELRSRFQRKCDPGVGPGPGRGGRGAGRYGASHSQPGDQRLPGDGRKIAAGGR